MMLHGTQYHDKRKEGVMDRDIPFATVVICAVLLSITGTFSAWAEQSGILLAQNNAGTPEQAAEESKPEFPPPPKPKLIVETEKPIDGGLSAGDEIAQEPPEAVSADTTAARSAPSVPPGTTGEDSVAVPPGAPSAPTGPPPEGLRLMEELSIFNVPTANLRTMKVVIDEQYNLRSIVYGEERGYIRVLEADYTGNFRETWISPPLASPVRGVFVEDLDNDGEADIVAYTSDGNIYIYGYESHRLKYRTQDDQYQKINCMIIANMDNSPELELLYIAVPPGADVSEGNPAGKLIQFDAGSQFEEWTSQEWYTATDMVFGNVDNDPDPEIILNTGEVLDSRFKDLKWRSDQPFGSRLYLVDLDNDGILELVTEYNESYVRVFDIDQRREKW